MSDKKISELIELTTANDNIEFIINDAGASKKIKKSTFVSQQTATEIKTSYEGLGTVPFTTDTATIAFAGTGIKYINATDAAGEIEFQTGANSNQTRLSATGNLTHSGKVGIGSTTAPVEMLDIKSASGDARIRLDAPTASDAEIMFYNNGAVQYTIGHDDGNDNFVIGSVNVDTPFVSVDKSGNVGIGIASPSDKLEVDGRVILHPTGLNGEGGELQIKGGGTNDDWQIDEVGAFFRVHSNNVVRLKISSTGELLCEGVYDNTTTAAENVNVDSVGTLQRSTSSKKYKKDIETLEDSYADAILNLRPVWFRSKCESDPAEYGYWGLIAEEVAEIDPRLVHWKTTEILTEVNEETGSPTETIVALDSPEAEGVQYSRIVPHLINILQRQRASMQELAARLDAIEGK